MTATNNKDALLPCPFCGCANVDKAKDEHDLYFVMCNGCSAGGANFTLGEGAHARAIEAWNRRAPVAEGDAPAWLWEYVGQDSYVKRFGLIARTVTEMDPTDPPYPECWRPVAPLYRAPLPAQPIADAGVARLTALAEKATPGPWEWWTSNSVVRLTGADGKDGGVMCAYRRMDYADICCKDDDRAYIAAANPAAILSLIARATLTEAERQAIADQARESEADALDATADHHAQCGREVRAAYFRDSAAAIRSRIGQPVAAKSKEAPPDDVDNTAAQVETLAPHRAPGVA